MDNTDKNEFLIQQQAALERMREMNSRAILQNEIHSMPPAPPFVRVNRNAGSPQHIDNNTKEKKSNHKNQNDNKGNSMHKGGRQRKEAGGLGSLLSGLKLPFLESIKTDSDISLILGILLILMSENVDRKLMLALLYIIM